mgnify:CR=1 FL=1
MANRLGKPIITQDLCDYGCGNQAQFINKSNKLMCKASSNSCPANRQKNSNKIKIIRENIPNELDFKSDIFEKFISSLTLKDFLVNL